MSPTRFPRFLPCCEHTHVLVNFTDCFSQTVTQQHALSRSGTSHKLLTRSTTLSLKQGESQLEGGKAPRSGMGSKHAWSCVKELRTQHLHNECSASQPQQNTADISMQDFVTNDHRQCRAPLWKVTHSQLGKATATNASPWKAAPTLEKGQRKGGE